MPVATRKAKPLARKYAEETIESSDDDASFAKVFGSANENSGTDDDESDFEKKSRTRNRKAKSKSKGKKANVKKKPPRDLPVPELSDDEDRRAGDTPELDEYPVHFDDFSATLSSSEPSSTTSPNILQIHVDATTTNGKATINLNLADLLSQAQTLNRGSFRKSQFSKNVPPIPSPAFADEDTTLIEIEALRPRVKRPKLNHSKVAEGYAAKTNSGFTDLPYELRIDIYRQIFTKRVPLHFTSKENFSRSSQFLRTCKLIHEEGRTVLYGENAFHFSRSSLTRGTYFEADWREIGWKDVRRFLEDIGPVNVGMLKYVSIFLTDAPPSVTPYLQEEERRCVNDAVLHRALKLIGSQAMLNKFAMGFQVRRTIVSSDYVFLKALSSIKCHQFTQARKWYSNNRLSYGLMDRLQKVMVIKKEVDANVDESKKKIQEPELYMD